MAISHISTTAFSVGAQTGMTLTIPAGATNGRLIVIAFRQMQAAITFTPAAGWTIVSQIQGGTGGAQKWGIAYKIAASDASVSRTPVTSNVATGAWEGVVSIYSGVDATTPVVATGSTNSSTMSTATLTVNAVTMTAANSFLYAVGANLANATPTHTSTMTNERYDAAPGTSGTFGVYDELVAASGSTGTRTMTLSVSQTGNVTLAIGINEAAPTTATLTQTTFRGRNDDGSETTATWKATAGTDWTQLVDTNFRVRFNVNASVAAPTQNTAFILRYSLNGAAFAPVSASSTVVRAVASPNVADGAATTEQLAGAGTFNAGTFDEVDGSATGFTAATATGQDTEVEYCVQIRSADVANGDTINLRVHLNTGQAIDAYTDTPIITVSESAAAASLIFDTSIRRSSLLRR